MTLYQFTIPVYTTTLKALDGLLVKAKDFVASGKITEDALLNERIAPDMFPFVKQVQVTCDNAKGVACRLSGKEVVKHEDNEKTLDELRARIAKTIDILNATPEESFANAASVKVTLPYFPGQYMPGEEYAASYATRNFYFHMTTAYDILRKLGMEIGKADYMGSIPLFDEKDEA